ncbi:flagellar basal body-associated FliL family protein [Aliiroseovarius sp. F47248L]|uniref:flagellar basal body-associated FliL family protein n=1 Tax=Aliiroseovarius sp. F47248L TaxID=2926420 RepID=UPI001FF3A81F|nr:flagellar basal body-associated FliL family protein [Aliiroseovarius sp. F47248L]MCK0140081.1 flagellar basal body-associated FliL family protein [Aliiroseovarius sp. F47248L]
MGKIFPIVLALIGLAAGGGAGYFLKPPPAPEIVNPCGDVGGEDDSQSDPDVIAHADVDSEFVKINNQFVIPIVNDEKVTALVVLSLSLEVSTGNREAVYQREPKLRDEFLQVMFNHANTGGFDGVFTQTSRLTNLRRALREVATSILGAVVHDVLVTNIVRQDQ